MLLRKRALGALTSTLADTEAGPFGIPEDDHPTIGQHARYSEEMPLPPIAGVEGLLDLPQTVRVRVQHQLLGVVAPVALLFGHRTFPLSSSTVQRDALYAGLPALNHEAAADRTALFTEVSRSGVLRSSVIALGHPLSSPSIRSPQRAPTLLELAPGRRGQLLRRPVERRVPVHGHARDLRVCGKPLFEIVLEREEVQAARRREAQLHPHTPAIRVRLGL